MSPPVGRRKYLLSLSDMHEDGFRHVVLRPLAHPRQQDFHPNGAVLVLAGEGNAVGLLRASAEAVKTLLKLFYVLERRDFTEEVSARDVSRRLMSFAVSFYS